MNNFGGLAFVRGHSEGVSPTGSTAWARGKRHRRFVQAVTRFPVLNNSMVVLVPKCKGSANLSIGVIVAEDRYLNNVH